MAAPSVHTTWAATAELLARVEQAPLPSDAQSVAAQLTLDALPWRLVKSGDADATPSCELTLDFGARALRCQVLQLQISSSARHVELYVDGVRRSLLGEDERSEVYFGTFRGAKATALGGATEQRFDVSEEFKQTTRDHDVLKQIHSVRVKFVSLTGDKNALGLTAFKCLYVATASAPAPVPQAAAVANESAMPSAADVMGMMAGLSVGGPGQLSPQAILLMVQQMMEREVETKIARALDAKLSVLAQRLSFSEQMLMQVQQKTAAKDAQLEQKLEVLQLQLSQLRDQVAEKKVEKETVDQADDPQ